MAGVGSDTGTQTGDKILHAVCAFLLHTRRGMGIGAQRKARCRMAKIILYGFDLVARAETVHGIGVPIGYNREQSEKPCNFNGLTTPKYSFSHDI